MTLHLTLKSKFFDMIAAGIKPEEYREIKPYWIKRFFDCNIPKEYTDDNKNFAEDVMYDYKNGHSWFDLLKGYQLTQKKFDTVVFTKGYSKTNGIVEAELFNISVGNPISELSDNWQGETFVLNLGKIISKHNID